MLVGGHPLTISMASICRPRVLTQMEGGFPRDERIGAWPSGKATGFGPVILGSNPSAPATITD